jgi:phosphoadenosine phosphosulfate reductase
MSDWRVVHGDCLQPVLDSDLFGESKDQRSIDILRRMEPEEGYWLAFSGGKDSCVLLDLAKRSGVRYEAHYNLTTIDPPELVQFIRREHPEVVVDKPERSFWTHIREGRCLPMRQSRWCCEELKERGGAGRRVLTGVRAAESASRAKYGLVQPCNKPEAKGKILIAPILHWSHDDVWTYIRRRGLAYCSLYDEGWERLGCVLCPFEMHPERAMARWPKLFAGLLRAVRYAYPTQAGFQKFRSPEAVLDWWLDRRRIFPPGDEQMAWDQFGEDEEARDD